MDRPDEAANKKKIIISTDSAADLKPEWIRMYDIRVIRHRLRTDRGVFEDESEIDSDGLCAYMRDDNNHAKSEVPDASRFEAFFTELTKTADTVLHISISSQTSPVYGEAEKVLQSFPGVHAFDSGDMACGAGLFVLYAAHLATQGKTADEIKEELTRFKREIRSAYVLKDTDYLQKGGRISSLLGGLLTAFLLHPVIVMKNGGMNYRFAWSSAYRKNFIRSMLRKPDRIDTSLLVISYAFLTDEELEWIRTEVKRYAGFERVVCLPTSGAVAVNVGGGTFGMAFRVRESGSVGTPMFDFLDKTEKEDVYEV